MNADYSDTVKWDETRKTYVDAYGYSSTQRSRFVTPAKIIAVPSEEGINLSVPVSSKKIELSSQLTMTGTAPIVMNSNYIRLQGLTDSQSIRYNTSNSNVEINGFTGTRILTGTSGATIATTLDSNGFQARKYTRSSGAFSTSQGSTMTVAAATRSLLPLGTMTNTGVSGSAWYTATIGSGNVLVAPFAGTIRAHVRVCSFAPNTAANYIFLRVYNSSLDATFSDGDEIITIGALSNGSQDYRGAGFATVTINAGERIGIAAHNGGGSSKDFQVLDYHIEYIG